MNGRWIWAAGLALVAALAIANSVQAAEPTRAGRVANTSGEALRLRATPNANAAILKRLGPGWRLTILGNPSADGHWLRVEHGGTIGYVAVGYVALDDAAPDPDPAPSSGTARSGRVANTDGANLRLRAAPVASAAILKRLGPDARVTVLGDPVGGGAWLKIEHDGTIGYVATDYIAFGEAPAPAAPAPSVGTPRAGWIANTDGANLRLRAAPRVDAAIVKSLAPGWQVTILEGPFADRAGATWVRLLHAGQTGYAAAAYVAGAAAGGGDAGPPPAPAPAAPTRLMVMENSRLRATPSLKGVVIAPLPAGSSVEAIGREISADGYRWANVRAYGREAWMAAGALGPLPGADTGRRLAGEALAQVGRPYVWGGETPARGFDCSGLTRWVVKNVTGVDITHVLAEQAQAGSPVDRPHLEVGDMVFFRDTYKPGLSHVGFYLGDGQFVAAQSERVGVARASMSTPYWNSRYYGARRISD